MCSSFYFYIVIPFPSVGGRGDFFFTGKIPNRIAFCSFFKFRQVSLINDLSAETSCFRSYVDDIICCTNYFSCSTTITVFPKACSSLNTFISKVVSRECNPILGSSRIYRDPTRLLPKDVARLIR